MLALLGTIQTKQTLTCFNWIAEGTILQNAHCH